jgi:anti-sigma regulatory factor (Ser/Thr protein kinase)
MSMPAPLLRLPMAANLGGLEVARLQARRFLQTAGLDDATLATVELVLEECVTNTLRYGYDSTGLRWIELEFVLQPDAVDLCIEDDANSFDPLSVPEPELPRSLEEARVGGLGLLMVRRATTDLHYVRLPGRNRLSARIARAACA